MRRVVFRAELFRSRAPRDVHYSKRALVTLVRALAEINASYLAEHPSTPLAVRAGVERRPELDASGEWRSVPELLERGEASSIDMLCWRLAELRAAQEDDRLVRRAAELAVERAHQSIPSVAFVVRLFGSELDRARSERALATMLHALARINADYLLTHPEVPSLYASNVRYQAERYPAEEWQAIPALYARGEGDCEDLACARVAELVVRSGVQARPTFRFRRLNHHGEPDISGRFSLYHILVELRDGTVEDPSALLGMGANPWAVSS